MYTIKHTIDKEVLKRIAHEAIAKEGASKERTLMEGILLAYKAGYSQALDDVKAQAQNN